MRLNETIKNPGLDMKAYMQPQCCQKKTFCICSLLQVQKCLT